MAAIHSDLLLSVLASCSWRRIFAGVYGSPPLLTTAACERNTRRPACALCCRSRNESACLTLVVFHFSLSGTAGCSAGYYVRSPLRVVW